jgi:hypothetical protein
MRWADTREDLFDYMYDLVDVLTFKSIFELTYKLFKTDAIDFLEGPPALFAVQRRL